MRSLLKRIWQKSIYGKKRINLDEQKAAAAMDFLGRKIDEGTMFDGQPLPFDPGILAPKKEGE